MCEILRSLRHEADDCLEALKWETQHLLPFVTAENIRDRSKADSFTKLFACIQSAWMIIQSIARWSTGLPITELELATVGFVVCAFIMYVLWWDKPFDVDQRIIVLLNYPERFLTHLEQFNIEPGDDYRVPDLDTWNFFDLAEDEGIELQALAFYVTGTLFSALHVSAWNWTFPSPIIRKLWRAFGITAFGSALIHLFLFLCTRLSPKLYLLWRARILDFAVCANIVSRLGLVILIFYCFSGMPVGVYETVDWTKHFPHFF